MNNIWNNPSQIKTRKLLRKKMPKGEKILWQHLRKKQLGFLFRRQYGIGNYTVDFYCPEVRLVIEVDGITHQSDTSASRDKERDKYIEKQGRIVKRYTSEQVFKNIETVKQDILNTCQSLL